VTDIVLDLSQKPAPPKEPAVVHFGAPAGNYTVEVDFPSGTKVVLNDVKADQLVEVVEPK
jgi:hypothetical protein